MDKENNLGWRLKVLTEWTDEKWRGIAQHVTAAYSQTHFELTASYTVCVCVCV